MAQANTGLISKISSAWSAFKGQASGTLIGKTEDTSRHDRMVKRFEVDQQRLVVIKDANEMYHGDDRVKGIIDKAAGGATYGGFTISVTEAAGAKVEAIQETLSETAKLFGKIKADVKKGLLEGDLFLQPVVDGNKIVRLIRMPASTLRRNSNELDEFDDPLRAFAQVDPLSGAAYALDLNLADVDVWFADWQIVHARWNHLDGRYGNSLLRSMRGSYKKTREGETDMAIRRKTRAGMKYIHELEDATDLEIEAYKERNKDTLNNPFAAVADFFTNKKTKVTAVQGDANLEQIADVKHHIDTMFISSPIPKSVLGYGQDINRDVLEKQEAQMFRNLEEIDDWVDDEIIKPVIELQLLLIGVIPESVDYSIIWPDRSNETFADVVDGAVKVKSLGLPDKVMLQLLKKVITDLDVDAVLEEMNATKEKDQADDAAAIANSLALMKGQMGQSAAGGKGQSDPAAPAPMRRVK